MSIQKRRITAPFLSTALVIGCLVLAACGSSSKGSSSNANGVAKTAASSATTSTAPGASHTGATAAPSQATGTSGPYALLKNPRFKQALTKFTACMHEHGVVNFPQPNLSGHASIYETKGLDTSSPQFGNALTKCRPELNSVLSMTTSAAPSP